MRHRFHLSALFFYGLVTLMIVITVISLFGALSWINKPFAGFLVYKKDALVASLGSRDWPGPKEGITSYLDRIAAIDGQPVQSGREIVDIVSLKKPGAKVHYLVSSQGKTREVIVPVSIFTLKDIVLVFLVPFLGGLALYSLGVIVFILKRNIASSWVFLLLCFSLGTYMVTGFEMQSSYKLHLLNSLATCLFPATFFHLGLIFPDRKHFLNRYPRLEYIIYLPAFVLLLFRQIYYFSSAELLSSHTLSWLPNLQQMGLMTRLFTFFCVVSLLIFVFHSMYRASTTVGRRRATMILFGVTIAFFPPVIITIVVAFMKVNFPWNFLVFFVIFFPASIAYSIVKHNLFDADEIIKRTLGYVVVTGIVVGAYAVVSVGLNVVADQYQLAQSKAFPILFTLGVILVFNPLRDRIQALVDRVFFRKEYDYGTIVDKVGGAMTSLLDLGQILKRLTQTFIEDMFINTGSVMLLTPDGTEYRVYLAEGDKKEDVEKVVIRRDNPLMEAIEVEKKELTKFDVLEDPKYREVSEKCVVDFEALHSSLMIPLVFQDKVIGSLNLGEKKSGKFYNREDIDLLRTLANQGAVAIENARLFQENLEKQRMEEELAIGRELQMSMLPSTCPEVKGFEIAAFSMPAMEVGGDFYDFIEMGDTRAGMVVGDVTGKSVSGALVMSASRSVFRMLSEEDLTVGEIMTRANRRIKQDIKSGMFVALLYAVLDSTESMLRLCSAGQTQPVLFSQETGEARLVETEGDTFPLGIIDEVDYQETRLQLAPGDRVVLYTDGIVEAMNEQDEMFGFDRLLEVVQGAGSMPAEAMLKEIVDRVNDFAGGAAQHDDLTVIVISAGE